MPLFHAVHADTGAILQTMAINDPGDLAGNIPDDAMAVPANEGEGPDTHHYDSETGSITVKPPIVLTLDQQRTARWVEARAYRESHAASGCATPLGRVDTDPDSRQKISGAVQMAMVAQSAGQPFAIEWTMSDNGIEQHNAVAMIAMGMAVGRFVDACQQAGTTIRGQIETAETIEALAAIDITAGYPA